MTGGEEALTEASNQPGIPPFRFYICYCWSGEWIYYLCQQTNTKNKKRLGVHATNQLLKEKQELPRQTTRSYPSSRAMIQLEKQAALCHPISLGTKNKLKRRRTYRNLRYNG